jgi:hypothetical protein
MCPATREQQEDARAAREEYQRLLATFDYAVFLENCGRESRLLIESAREGAVYVADEALHALANRSPFLMIRIGDGEANLLRFAAHEGSFELKWVNALFVLHDNQRLSIEDSRAIAQDMLSGIAIADVVGLRPLCPAPLDQHFNAISQTIENGDMRGALGMIGAFQHADRAVRNHELRHAVITSAWVHLTLLEHLDRLLEAAPRVIVISGREELAALFSRKLGSRLAAFLAIPLQASDQASVQRSFHYPIRYRQILEALAGDLSGTLVLVGAGIFGKKYCAVAKQHGAVALDLGSAFDVLAGVRTRPVHSIAQFLDLKRESWLTISSG